MERPNEKECDDDDVVQVLHKETWRDEANAVIRDIRCGVREARISEQLCTASNDDCIYVNVTTIEGARLCIELSSRGFRVAGRRHDSRDIDESLHYETPYALFNEVSAGFSRLFGRTLSDRLIALNAMRDGTNDDQQDEDGIE